MLSFCIYAFFYYVTQIMIFYVLVSLILYLPFTLFQDFTTKLSIQKFVAVVKSLSHAQRILVRSMGLDDLLDISCDRLPKSVILWVVKFFDVRTRTIHLPNGFSITVSSFMVHRVLGTPIGGKSVPSSCSEANLKFIKEETRCSGQTPSINELMDMFNESLTGDKFKRIFMLFALSCFLCPTSYDHVSPEFYEAVMKPDDIKLYDWSALILDKLVLSIYKFKKSDNTCGVAALGGCTLLLPVTALFFCHVCIYFPCILVLVSIFLF